MEIIDPFYLYLILQLDSIKEFLGGPALGMPLVVAIMATVGLSIGIVVNDEPYNATLRDGLSKMRRWAIAVIFTATPLMVLNVFIPTSERMAVLVVVPAIANNTALQEEAGELYALAKRGLTKLIDEEQPPAATEEND
jgi:hypothetical protein